MKVPVFFRTRSELDDIKTFIMEVSDEIRKQVGWDRASYIQMTTKYTEKSPVYENIPKKKRGKKKYMAVIHANKEKMQRLNIDLEERLSELNGVELVKRSDDGPKYKGEKTKGEFIATSESQFSALISVLDKGFGRGNWRIRGPKGNVRQLIKRVEDARTNTDNPFLMQYVKKYKDGVPLRITVNEANADLNKYLFKVRLKA